MNTTITVPDNVSALCAVLSQNGFESYLVGGCVRDSIMNRTPKDWDITTNALPETIVSLCEAAGYRAVYENTFGTVGIVFEDEPVDSPTRTIEITTYRTEEGYGDNRHPDTVQFVSNVEDDLSRRDFTVNAIAYDPLTHTTIDPFGGQNDITTKTLKAVGDPRKRFTEDALRIMRCIRFVSQLGFACESETMTGVMDTKHLLDNVSRERIRDEVSKIITTDSPALAFMLMERIGLLPYVMPELVPGVGCEQKGEHVYDVFHHLVFAMQHAADKGYDFEIRLAALLHDIGKPKTRAWSPEKNKYTFYGHEVVGARMAKKILENLKFSRETTDRIVTYVRWHMFFSDVEKISLSAVRRLVANVSREHIWDMMKVRECDRVGMKKKEAPYRLRKYFAMIEQVLHDPISVGMLNIDGAVLMDECRVKPGRAMGWILHALLEEVIEDPSKNVREFLVKRAIQLAELPENELKQLGESGKATKDQEEDKLIETLHAKHRVTK